MFELLAQAATEPHVVNSDAVSLWHLVVLVLGMAGSVGTAAIAGCKWLAKHFDKLGEERAQERARDNVLIEEQRKDFLDTLVKTHTRFATAMTTLEQECSKQRDLDRKEREQNQQTVLDLVGRLTNGDAGAFKVQRAGQHGPRQGETAP